MHFVSLESRLWPREGVASFRRSKDEYGAFSNMTRRFPLRVNNLTVPTSEALYQALKHIDNPDVQREIIAQSNPMEAARIGRTAPGMRSDWDDVKIEIMRWCLQVKLAQHFGEFGRLLLRTGDMPIVEDSRRDNFWGAIPETDGFRGINMLGQLLMQVRGNARAMQELGELVVQPPLHLGLLLMRESVGVVEGAV